MAPADGFSLRRATGADAHFLAAMLVAAVNWDDTRAAVTAQAVLSEPRTAHYAADWPIPGDVGVIAMDAAGEPIGAAWLRLFTPEDPGYGFVAADTPELSVGVVKRWRGKGVGRALVRELLRRGAEHGYRRVSLSVERANRARALYLDEGFVVVESGPDADTMVTGIEELAGRLPEPP